VEESPGHEAANRRIVTECDDTRVAPTWHPPSTEAGQHEGRDPRFRSSHP
jgi:hypothetical protein